MKSADGPTSLEVSPCKILIPISKHLCQLSVWTKGKEFFGVLLLLEDEGFEFKTELKEHFGEIFHLKRGQVFGSL